MSVVFATKDSVKKLIFKSMKQLTAAPLHTSVLTVIKPLDILPTSTRTLPPTVMSGKRKELENLRKKLVI